MRDAADLNGRWHGIFDYPDGSPSTMFEAHLREIGGILAGETWEASDGIGDVAPVQCAVLEGRHDGHAVCFTKRYDELHRAIVDYSGVLAGDGSEIAGRWTIAGVWSGGFLMTRPLAATREVAETVSAPVD